MSDFLLPFSNCCVSLLKVALGVENIPPFATGLAAILVKASQRKSQDATFSHTVRCNICTETAAQHNGATCTQTMFTTRLGDVYRLKITMVTTTITIATSLLRMRKMFMAGKSQEIWR